MGRSEGKKKKIEFFFVFSSCSRVIPTTKGRGQARAFSRSLFELLRESKTTTQARGLSLSLSLALSHSLSSSLFLSLSFSFSFSCWKKKTRKYVRRTAKCTKRNV